MPIAHYKTHCVRAALAMPLCLFLAACGQKGALYLAQDPAAENAAEAVTTPLATSEQSNPDPQLAADPKPETDKKQTPSRAK